MILSTFFYPFNQYYSPGTFYIITPLKYIMVTHKLHVTMQPSPFIWVMWKCVWQYLCTGWHCRIKWVLSNIAHIVLTYCKAVLHLKQ